MTQAIEPSVVTLSIDGRDVTTEPGATILQAARESGIDIPTLCHHDDLSPFGACRLCVVDVTRNGWDGWQKMVVSCMASAEEGLIVSTKSERVMETRKVLLDLLLARNPNTKVVRDLAREHGLLESTFRTNQTATDCILCGLCTRVCDTYATSAIATISRGTNKDVGTFDNAPPEDCVGCGACAQICPTGHIKDERSLEGYTIWNRNFEPPLCIVDDAHCIGCGRCEETCPFSVARVTIRADGRRVATIAEEHCRGCGACIGVCPSGAIDQEQNHFSDLIDQLDGRKLIISCPRSALNGQSESVQVLRLPCTGRVSTPLLLAAVAKGAREVLVLGRHAPTCRLGRAEDPARTVVDQTSDLLRLIGLEAHIRFGEPEPGLHGPRKTLMSIEQSGAAAELPDEEVYLAEDEGLEGALTQLVRLSKQGNRDAQRADSRYGSPNGTMWLRHHRFDPPKPDKPVLVAGALPFLDLMVGQDLAPVQIPQLLHRVLELLEAIDIDARLFPSFAESLPAALSKDVHVLSLSDGETLARRGINAFDLFPLLLANAPRFAKPRWTRIANDGSPELTAIIKALGFFPVDVGPDPLPDELTFPPDTVKEAEDQLVLAEQNGARVLLVKDSMALMRWALVTRRGSWRRSRVLPMAPSELFWHTMKGTPFNHRALTVERAEHRSARPFQSQEMES